MRKPPPLLSRADVARRLNCSPDTVKRLARRGLLEERHVGPRLVRVTPESVDALLAARHAEAA